MFSKYINILIIPQNVSYDVIHINMYMKISYSECPNTFLSHCTSKLNVDVDEITGAI